MAHQGTPQRARFPPNICALSKRKGMFYLHYAIQRADRTAEKNEQSKKSINSKSIRATQVNSDFYRTGVIEFESLAFVRFIS